LFLHSFRAATNFDRNAAGIFILAPAAAKAGSQP
jgi:hypothetical protein